MGLVLPFCNITSCHFGQFNSSWKSKRKLVFWSLLGVDREWLMEQLIPIETSNFNGHFQFPKRCGRDRSNHPPRMSLRSRTQMDRRKASLLRSSTCVFQECTRTIEISAKSLKTRSMNNLACPWYRSRCRSHKYWIMKGGLRIWKAAVDVSAGVPTLDIYTFAGTVEITCSSSTYYWKCIRAAVSKYGWTNLHVRSSLSTQIGGGVRLGRLWSWARAWQMWHYSSTRSPIEKSRGKQLVSLTTDFGLLLVFPTWERLLVVVELSLNP